MVSSTKAIAFCTILSLGGPTLSGRLPPLALGIITLRDGAKSSCPFLIFCPRVVKNSQSTPSRVFRSIPGVIFPSLPLIISYDANRNSGSEMMSIKFLIRLSTLGKPSIRSFNQLETGAIGRSPWGESGPEAPFLCLETDEEYSLLRLSPFAIGLLRGFRLRMLPVFNIPEA